ncbi:hypothetical protein BM525_21205 (plasmid) [Alteromonas mediterranea]|uniref:DUF559 domain-containing protein n=1 Tax=Alteromonas mediterranea TaxID=314275 RepID=A0AAC9JEY2_9ALTE|nr:hypothetical protein [Alteromonas mediterranea]APD92379.1 hypothetical protein BM524_20985 [Alteromonas mediterranea]APE00240.1 hypothetical protein BM525_21205 [Alteromonas mediterranea]
MRIKSADDINQLGTHAKKQIEAVLKQQGGFNNQKRPGSIHDIKRSVTSTASNKTLTPSVEAEKNATPQQKAKPSRVMRTAEGLTYCPWPSTDPFVSVIQQLEAKYGRYDDGGWLLTELIIDGGTKNWRFDIALISPFEMVDLHGQPMLLGYSCLVEADGFGFHRSKDAFKNDRAKQTHALKQGFVVKRITNEDARHRLNEVVDDIEHILSLPRLYNANYTINGKGRTQSVLRWEKSS